MTAYTKTDLMNAVLEKLVVKDIGEEAGADEAAKTKREIQRVLEYLEDEKLQIFDYTAADDVANIPARIFHALVDLVSYRAGPDLGHPQDDKKWAQGMYQVRRSVLQGEDDVPIGVNYF